MDIDLKGSKQISKKQVIMLLTLAILESLETISTKWHGVQTPFISIYFII